MLTCLQSDFDEIILFTKPVNRSNTLFWILRIEHGKYFMDETQSSAYISTHLEVSSNTIQVLHTHFFTSHPQAQNTVHISYTELYRYDSLFGRSEVRNNAKQNKRSENKNSTDTHTIHTFGN